MRLNMPERLTSEYVWTEGDELHFDAPAFLRAHNLPLTPENEAAAVEGFRSAARSILGELPIREVTDR